MAAGYIGKISAVVTANTSDLTKKLNDAGTNSKRFAETLNRSISSAANSAQNSLQKIFTPLQNIERRLQTSLRIPGLDLPVEKIRQAVSITEQINKPLAQAASGFTNLSLEVQGAFLPALQRAQDQAVSLNLQLQDTGRVSAASFAQAQRSIDDLIAAQSRLQQAQSLAARSMTGKELQFANPSLFQALQASSSLTAKAGALPASRLADGVIAKSVRELNQYQQAALQAQARLESLRLDPKIDPTVIEAQKKRVENLVETVVRAQAQLASLTTTPKTTVTTTDPSGRTIPQRLQEINAVANARRLERDVLNEIQEAEARAKLTTQQRLALANELLAVTNTQAAAAGSEAARRLSAASRFSDTFGGPGVGLNTVFAEKALQGYTVQLQILQGALGRVSSEARGPAAVSFAKLRDEIARAMNKGELETEQTRAKLKLLTQEAVAAIAAVANINAKTLGRSVARAGDIGRLGFDRFSLAANQAAFAIDDFFSSTGGLEFKLRAVQNNLTQLAFILGGTKGLFIGLAGVISAQLVIGLLKANGLLQSQRDVLNSLNDAFREQQQRVAALTEAYGKLGESIRDAGLDEAGRTQAGRRRDLDEIRRQEEEARIARAAAVDPEVNRLRAERSRLQRENEESRSGAVRATNEIEIGRLNQEIERRSREVAARQSTPETVRQTLESVGLAEIERQVAEFIRRGALDPQQIEQFRERRQRELRQQVAGIDLSTADAELAALDQARQEVRARMDENSGLSGFSRDGSGENYNALNAQLESLTAEYAALETRIRGAEPGEALIRVTEAAFRVGDALDRARADLDSTGIGRTRAGDVLTSVNADINRLRDEAQQARNEGNVQRLNQIEAEITNVFGRLAAAAAASAGGLAVFSDVISRISDDLNETVLEEVRERAEQARRLRNEAGAALGLNAIGNNFANADGFIADEVERRARAEARRAEDEAARVQEENTRLRQQFAEDALSGAFGAAPQNAINVLLAERRRIQQQIDSGALGYAEEQAAARRQREIDRELDRMFEDSDAGRRARVNADNADRAAAEARLRADSAARGERLLQSDAEQAARGIVQALQDIENATQLRIDSGFGIIPGADQEARARVLEDARRQAAPALFALQDAVANAVLQGPSRQALNAADISTQQGTAELNRLLRGDDSARDQNLLELQKQTAELEKLNANLGAAGVAD